MPRDMHTVYLGFGSNLGNREQAIKAARDRLPPLVEIIVCSSLYQTPPWGVLEQPPFLNAVCMARTTLAPQKLLAYLKAIEEQLGRTPTFRWGPRAIDIDILIYDDLVLQSEHLTIPHPRLAERPFVLVPLSEIAPNLRHPLLNQTIQELAAAGAIGDITRVTEAW